MLYYREQSPENQREIKRVIKDFDSLIQSFGTDSEIWNMLDSITRACIRNYIVKAELKIGNARGK